jgi:hypothetical protein
MRHVLALLLVVSSGCSWLIVDAPPPVDPGFRPAPCTSSKAAPMIDAVTGGTFLTVAAIFAAVALSPQGVGESNADFSDRRAIGGTFALTYGVIGLPFALSASSGFDKVNRCRAMNATPPRGYQYQPYPSQYGQPYGPAPQPYAPQPQPGRIRP